MADWYAEDVGRRAGCGITGLSVMGDVVWLCRGVPYVEMGGSRLMAATRPCGLLGSLLGKGLMWPGRDVLLCQSERPKGLCGGLALVGL